MSVEEVVNTNSNSRPKTKTRPKPVSRWTVGDVLKWYRLHCEKYPQYEDLFSQHEITGCAFLRLSDDALRRMGIKSDQDREAILREILKQRLKADIMEFRDIDFMNIYYN